MSADPVTMFAVTAVSTLLDIRESKKQSKAEQALYEEQKKDLQRQAEQAEEDRKDRWRELAAANNAIQAGSGYSIKSMSFLNIQDVAKEKMEKDLGNIRINLASDLRQVGFNQKISKSQRKQEQFGGWATIVSSGVEAKAKKDKYA
jgi:mannitol-specific phosphotransferase system IIBC component